MKINKLEFDNLEDVIWELVQFALEIDNIQFLRKLYETYTLEFELAYLKIPNMIIDSIVKQFQKNLQLTFFLDKIKILDKIWNFCGFSAAAAFQLSKLLRKLLKQPPSTNILSNWYNPIRLTIIIITLLRSINN